MVEGQEKLVEGQVRLVEGQENQTKVLQNQDLQLGKLENEQSSLGHKFDRLFEFLSEKVNARLDNLEDRMNRLEGKK